MPYPNVIVIDHPVVQTKLAELRDYTADHRKFRSLLDEIAMLMTYEVTRDWPTQPKPVQTPLERMTGRVLARQEEAFLAATHARIAVASAGVDNDYGHP